MFNTDLVFDYLLTSENNIHEIGRHEDQFAKYFLFLRAMQAAIDTSFTLIINLDLKKPKNYLETFTILNDGNVISKETSEKMRAFAALRSKLIFDTEVNFDNELNTIFSEFSSVFVNFSSEIKEFIKNFNSSK